MRNEDKRRELRVTLKWRYHTANFASLMVGHIELAQISKSSVDDNEWFYTYFHLKHGTKGTGASSEENAKFNCEIHAGLILTMD